MRRLSWNIFVETRTLLKHDYLPSNILVLVLFGLTLQTTINTLDAQAQKINGHKDSKFDRLNGETHTYRVFSTFSSLQNYISAMNRDFNKRIHNKTVTPIVFCKGVFITAFFNKADWFNAGWFFRKVLYKMKDAKMEL